MSRQLGIRASDQPMVINIEPIAIKKYITLWLPQKSLPPYAYLPGKNPHPVRDPAGHSYHVEPIPVPRRRHLGSGLIDHSQNMTAAAIQIAEK